MEKIKGNLSQTVRTLSRTPLKNMVSDNILYSQNSLTLNESRIRIFKRFMFWFLIIILLSLYGLNIFNYLAKGTDIITALLSPFTYVIALVTGTTINTTIQNISQGGQVIITHISDFFGAILKFITQLLTGSLKAAETTSGSAIGQLQSNIMKDKLNSDELKKTNQTNDEEPESSIFKNERKINERSSDVSKEVKNTVQRKENTEPAPLQSNSNENGYCYIGTTNNVRNCAKVSSRNKCMSGDIFPTIDICINPNLRR